MLAREIGAEYLSLGKYISDHRLFSGVDRKRKTRVVDLIRTRHRMRSFTEPDAPPLIVDTHHPEGIVRNNVTSLVFVLRCDPTILIRRLQRKKWHQEKIRENVMAEVLDYCFINAQSYYTRGKIVQLDTSRSSVKGSVKRAKKILSRTKPPSLHVDWLRKLEKDPSLSKYLWC
jgi:adenylate kinase